MNINAINAFPSIAPISSGDSAVQGSEKSAGGFGSLMKDAIESLEGSQKGADEEISRAVTGESTDLHKTIISLQSADLKFQLGLQVRNKLLGAYEEVMRMQV